MRALWILRPALGVVVLGPAAWANYELTALSCSQEASLRPTADNTPATIRFVNATGEPMNAHRLDSAGKRVFDSTIPASGTIVRQTTLTQPWVITRASGQCRSIYLPVAGEAIARITDLSIVLPQSGIIFTALAGGPSPPPQSFAIINGGTGSMNWAVSIPMMTGEMTRGWLRLSPISGSSDADKPIPRVEARVDTEGLEPGEYCLLTEVSAPGAINSPQNFCVILLLLPADSPIGPSVDTAGLTFTGENPPPQTLKVFNPARRPLTLVCTAKTSGATNWVSIEPARKTVASGEVAAVSVRPVAGLPAGSHQAELELRFEEGGPVSKVTLQAVVPDAVAAKQTTGGRRTAGGACTPTKLVPVFTALGPSFTCQAGWPIPIEVFVVDDCANPMTTGSVEATFSNNDPPLRLSPLPGGRWSGTWPPRNARPTGMTITVRAQQPDKRIEGTAQISGGLEAASDVPVVAPGGVVNAASYSAAPAGPGSFIAIFGEKLSNGLELASQLPLQTLMQGTEVFISGRTIPLVFTSSNQVNAMVPYNIAVNGRHQLIVRRGHCMSVPEPIEVTHAQPAIFTKDGTGKGQGHIYRVTAAGEQVLAGPESPARAGDTIVIYAAGLGLVNPLVEAGAAVPASPLANTIHPVTVTIGDKEARTLFAGLVPGFTGLYQVNAIVPEGVAPGDNTPVVLAAAGQAGPPVTIAVR